MPATNATVTKRYVLRLHPKARTTSEGVVTATPFWAAEEVRNRAGIKKPNVLPHPPTAEPCVAVAIIQILKWPPSGEVNYIYTTHTHTHTVSTPIRAQILTRADMPGQIYDKHTHTHTLAQKYLIELLMWSASGVHKQSPKV